jgi:putative ABC transport system substrate-binding protein
MRRREFIAGVSAAMATLPVAAGAQQLAAPVIGFLSWANSTGLAGPAMAAFRRGLAEQGYVEGRSLTILFRWAEFRQFAILIGDLANQIYELQSMRPQPARAPIARAAE